VWLTRAIATTDPDVIAIAMQYIRGAPPVLDAHGVQIAGDAAYGPAESIVNGTISKTADFNDYLGVPWTYPQERTVQPEPSQLHAVDCSGFMRMIWGYRSGLPLQLDRTSTASLPRRSGQLLATAPGVVLIADDGTRPSDLSKLMTGDLVFFASHEVDATTIDHVGMYLGHDNADHPRFISSRKSVDGPTIGDLNDPSLLDGDTLYARTLRGVRRL
jgi:cell wall-associated NlpC family hydrolase